MINNYQKGEIELNKVSRLGYKPRLLLHACCGPCSTYPLELLTKYFEVTVYFNNSNIYPSEEYSLRLKTIKDYIQKCNQNSKTFIDFVEIPYNNEEYMKILQYRKDDKENGPRCKLCYSLRMKAMFEYAVANNYEYCCTVMSMSRQKDEQAINKIGTILQTKYPKVKYLVHNFKKKGGQERRDEIVNSLQMYDQKYCGCLYSYNEMLEKKNKNQD